MLDHVMKNVKLPSSLQLFSCIKSTKPRS